MDWETERYERAVLMTCGCLATLENYRICFTKGFPAGNRKKADDCAIKLILWYETFLTYFRGESRSDQNTLSASLEVINERLEWAVHRITDYLKGKSIQDDFFLTIYRGLVELKNLTYSEASKLVSKQGEMYLDQIDSQIKDDWLRERFLEWLPIVQAFYSEFELYTM